jgi:hypothetical protein
MTDRLSSYVGGESSLEAFDQWFVPTTWDINEVEDPIAYYISGEISLLLAEYTQGDRTEDELKAALLLLIESHAVVPAGAGTASFHRH